MGCSGSSERAGKIRPTVRRAHIDHPNRLKPRPGRLDTEQPGCLAVLNTAPEFLLCGDQEVLVERIGVNSELNPFSAPGNDGEDRRSRVGDPHVVLQLRHVFFSRRFLRERPGKHEFGFEYGPTGIDETVEGCRHPFDHRVLHPPLHVLDDSGPCFARTSAD